MGRGRVAVDHLGELVVLELSREVQVRQSRQVVEAVAVLQGFELGFEDEVERRAQHAAEHQLLFGQAADPEIDVVEAAELVSVA